MNFLLPFRSTAFKAFHIFFRFHLFSPLGAFICENGALFLSACHVRSDAHLFHAFILPFLPWLRMNPLEIVPWATCSFALDFCDLSIFFYFFDSPGMPCYFQCSQSAAHLSALKEIEKRSKDEEDMTGFDPVQRRVLREYEIKIVQREFTPRHDDFPSILSAYHNQPDFLLLSRSIYCQIHCSNTDGYQLFRRQTFRAYFWTILLRFSRIISKFTLRSAIISYIFHEIVSTPPKILISHWCFWTVCFYFDDFFNYRFFLREKTLAALIWLSSCSAGLSFDLSAQLVQSMHTEDIIRERTHLSFHFL